MKERPPTDDQTLGCNWVLIIKYGDPNTNVPLSTGFGPFPTKEDADSFRSQYYYDQIVIAEIVPLNAVFPESATELDIDFVPTGKVVDIRSKINIEKH
tara:strand:- start:1665 stop:1958 length:294 start_codon:yes stop_codon:yes gene_type:complete